MLKLLKVHNLLDYKKAFQSQEELQSFQDAILQRNLGLTRLSLQDHPIISEHPEYQSKVGVLVAPLRTTGTSNNRMRYYWYPRKEYEIIQRYHFERLMFFNDIPHGNVVRLIPRYSCDDEKFSTLGLQKGPLDIAMSYSNVTWYAVYPPANIPDRMFWKSLFKDMEKLNPVAIYCTPGEFQLFCDEPITLPKCPIVFSGETLYPHVRKKAESMFPAVIDKMRCWDGGLSFFECKYGTKHINDELAIVEKIGDTLVSTDLFNFNHRFIRYFNGDCGDISQGSCQCGIWGSYFTNFSGRDIECLVSSRGEKIIPGIAVVNRVLQICNSRKEFEGIDFKFNIVQNQDRNVVIYGNADLNEKQQFLLCFQVLTTICSNKLYDIKVEYIKKDITPLNAKQLLVRSYAKR